MISDERFRKKEHLLKSKDFRNVYKKGRSFKEEGIVLYCTKNEAEYSRIGFSISSRSVKEATRRNRVRRILRELYRNNKDKLKKGFDLIFVVKKLPEPAAVSKETQEAFSRLARKADIFL